MAAEVPGGDMQILLKQQRAHLARRLAPALLVGAIAAPALLGLVGAHAADGDLTWSATIGGRTVTQAGSGDPLELRPEDTMPVTLEVGNAGPSQVDVRSVRLEGRVLGLAFFVYTTRIDMTVPPGGDDSRSFDLDLADLDGQGTGLIPARLTLLGEQGETLAVGEFPVDVRGSLWSVYGTFGLAVAAITVVLLAGALIRLSRGRLPASRLGRAATFAIPGAGAGFTTTFALSALAVLVPSAGAWVLFILFGATIGFLAGYLTPAPDGEGWAEYMERLMMNQETPSR